MSMIHDAEAARILADAMRSSSRELARSGLASRHIHSVSAALGALAELLEYADPPVPIEHQTALFELVTAGLSAQSQTARADPAPRGPGS
jgi:hypothetical protein